MNYVIYFKIDDMALKLPINPEEVQFVYETAINRYEIIGLGEISEFSADKLVSTQINSLLPSINTNLITNSNVTAKTFVDKVNSARSEGEVIELVIHRDSLDNINLNCYVQQFNVIEKAGEVDDVYFGVNLLEWRPHSAQIVDIQQPAPIQIQVPVETTASQYLALVNSNAKKTENNTKVNAMTGTDIKEIRVEATEKPITTSEIVRGDYVTVNGNGYNTAGGFLGLHKRFNTFRGKIESIVTDKPYPYKIRTNEKSGKSDSITLSYYFAKSSISKG